MSSHAEPLIVIGAGGLARETLEAVRAANDVAPRWSVIGLADDDPSLEGDLIGGYPVIGPLEIIDDHPDASIVICVASPYRNRARKAIAERLGLEPSRLATIVHPAAILSTSTSLGPGCLVLAAVVSTADASVGAHVILMPSSVLTHDDEIADFCTFGAGVRLAGRVRVAEGAYVGSGALVREDRSIGAWSVVGMGSVVTRDVPDHEVWAGVPARCIATREDR